MVNGLTSQDRSKLINSLQSAPDLIEENLSDLDLVLYNLSEILLKIENHFNFSEFEELRFKSLVALSCMRPNEMCDILINRLSDSGCSTAGKILVFDIIKEMARKLANPQKIEKIQKKYEEKISKYAIIQERLKKKTRRFISKPKPVFFGTPNLFFQHFERYCSGIVRILDSKAHFLVLSKGIYTLSELIDHAGPSCDITMMTQCTYIIRNIIKPLISSEKREIVESVLILFIKISEKMELSDFIETHNSIIQDINEIAIKIENLSGNLQDLAERCLLSLVKYRI